MCKANPYRAVFFERDGVLTDQLIDGHAHWRSPISPAEFKVKEELNDLLIPLQKKGYKLIAFTYQPLVGKGELSRTAVDLMNKILQKQLARIEDIRMCLHDPVERCSCGRGLPGLFTEAQAAYHLDLRRSFIVSNKWHDGRAGRLAECEAYLIDSPWSKPPAPSGVVVADLREALARIVRFGT